METLLQGLPNLRIRQRIRDDDSIDQLHHFVTVYLFAFAGFLIGLKEFIGEPLDCWVNLSNWQHFQTHVNSYCWSHRMFRFPNKSSLGQNPYPLAQGLAGPGEVKPNEDDEINFYRWITVVFFIQAFFFKLPALIWTELNESSGTQLEKIVTMIRDSTFAVKEKRDATFANVAEFLETWLKINRKPFWFMRSQIGLQTKKVLRYCMLCVGGNTGNYLSSLYLTVKFLFLFNVIMQFCLLTLFLEFNFWDYGPYALSLPSPGHNNIHFPRIGLCHFQLREQGYWVQCNLSINMLLEKIFLIEWFWMLFLLIVTILNFFMWILRTLQTHLSERFIKKYLAVMNEDGSLPKKGHKTVNNFLTNYLGNDGVFVLRILATNTNDVAMAELVSFVWHRYLNYENKVILDRDSSSKSKRDSFLKKDGTVLEMDPIEEKTIV